MRQILAVLLAAILLSACGLLPQQVDETANWSAAKLYNRAKEALQDQNYTDAVKYFEKLEARYPYGPYAQQAQLEEAYAYYKDDERDSSVEACNRFIKLHPDHPHVDYAYYLKGLASFNESKGPLSFLASADLSRNDPQSDRESYDAFKELVTRFPHSKYAPDARSRMRYLLNSLAWHEIHVAQYYYKRGAYVAAANRVKYALEHYQQSPAIKPGLVIMADSYGKLGLDGLRKDTLQVLNKNFPKGSSSAPVKKKKAWWHFW